MHSSREQRKNNNFNIVTLQKLKFKSVGIESKTIVLVEINKKVIEVNNVFLGDVKLHIDVSKSEILKVLMT